MHEDGTHRRVELDSDESVFLDGTSEVVCVESQNLARSGRDCLAAEDRHCEHQQTQDNDEWARVNHLREQRVVCRY